MASTCDNCGKKGHRRKDCWSKPTTGGGKGGKSPGAGKGSPKKFEGNCHNCGKPGHRKKDCWGAGGGASSNASPKGRSKGKDAGALEDQGEPEGEANALELCAVTADRWKKLGRLREG